MKKLALCTAVSAAAIMMSQSALADRVKGSARADFANDELRVPCVQIEGYSDAADGQFFDIVLKRRGKSLNYLVTFAEKEDAAVCEELANYAVYIDDDEEEFEDRDDDSDDVNDDDSDDDDDDSDDAEAITNLFASCEVRHELEEQTRSKVKVKAKNLAEGEYLAAITSGENTVQSETRTVSGDEVEFEFDSDADDVLEGAEAIEASFIVDQKVTAELIDAVSGEVVLSETVSCLVRNKSNK